MRRRSDGRSPPRAAGRLPWSSLTNASWRADMRTMFFLYLVLIVAGIAYFSVIGLVHN
jgi:hypothetical protein